MSTRICALVAVCLLVPSIAGRAQQPAAPAAPPVPLIDAEYLIMQPEQAATGARVMGDGRPVKTAQAEVDEKGEPVRRK
jgi:hypothetical protein